MAASTEKSMPMVDVVEGTEGFDSKQKKDEGYHNPSEEKVEFSHYFVLIHSFKMDLRCRADLVSASFHMLRSSMHACFLLGAPPQLVLAL